ncbi:MAG: FAD-dependent oxidoreductase [Oscillospiraceae bacterium]|nr:FAD-dependent oxidoreductase [Oscillospiraceae bacterium]
MQNHSKEAINTADSSWSPAVATGGVVTEPVKKLNICDEADVIVVGGGPGGMGAAVSAARSGAKTILVERYGCLGGMATGGLVTIFPNMADSDGNILINGICEESIQRLRDRDACFHPPREKWGSKDPEEVKYFRNASFFCDGGYYVNYAAHVDAEELKIVYDEMVEAEGIKTYLHSWGTSAIVDSTGKKVVGVVFESKSGRQAILGKVVIDCTGDGDLLPSAGADFDAFIPKGMRISAASHCFWIANVDLARFDEWRNSTTGAEEYAAQAKELVATGGHPSQILSHIHNQESLMWYHPRQDCDQCDVENLTSVEFAGRKKMKATLDYRRANTPGFEKAYLVLSSPQLGTRGSRRVIGEYMLNQEDISAGKTHDDTIALFPWTPSFREYRGEALHVPYRCLVPKGVDGLLVACRATSMDLHVSEYYNLIPHCIAFGQAAGTAAAQASAGNIEVRDVDIKALQSSLREQDVILP